VKLTRRRFIAQAAATVVGAKWLGVPEAFAQDARAWPERPLKIIVGYAPGGGNDLAARLVAQSMSATLGQSVVVENRTGAGGIVGTDAVAKAKPDGYTLMLGTSSQLVMNVALFPKLPFDVQKDIAPVALISRTPQSLLCKIGLPVKTLADFIALAKATPAQMNYGTVGLGSITHVGAESFLRAAGLQIQAVHYRGQPAALQALMSGEVDMLFDASPNLAGELVSGGKVRALAVSLKRSNALPGVPTFEEAGLKGADSYTWNSIMAPGGTPQAIIEKLNRAVNDALQTAPLQEMFAKGGIEPLTGSTPASTGEFWRREREYWVPLVQGMGIKV
jgi:tripartite-type tricarboxylate transporter receptor subunit TctC